MCKLRFSEFKCQVTKGFLVVSKRNNNRGKRMPTKHIPDDTWRKVESETVKAVIKTKRSIKDTEMLNILILKGLESIEDEDYQKLVSDRKE